MNTKAITWAMAGAFLLVVGAARPARPTAAAANRGDAAIVELELEPDLRAGSGGTVDQLAPLVPYQGKPALQNTLVAQAGEQPGQRTLAHRLTGAR